MTSISIRTAEHYRWGNDCDGWHLVKRPELSIIQERVPPGGAERRHYHDRADQFFFVLRGTATLELDDETHEVPAEHGLFVPAGTVHRLVNNGDVPLEFLVTSSPMSHGDRTDVDPLRRRES